MTVEQGYKQKINRLKNSIELLMEEQQKIKKMRGKFWKKSLISRYDIMILKRMMAIEYIEKSKKNVSWVQIQKKCGFTRTF